MTLVLLLSTVCFLAYADGTNDNFKGAASPFGIGLAGGQANGGTIVSILWSWLLTLPCATLCAALIYSVTSGF